MSAANNQDNFSQKNEETETHTEHRGITAEYRTITASRSSIIPQIKSIERRLIDSFIRRKSSTTVDEDRVEPTKRKSSLKKPTPVPKEVTDGLLDNSFFLLAEHELLAAAKIDVRPAMARVSITKGPGRSGTLSDSRSFTSLVDEPSEIVSYTSSRAKTEDQDAKTTDDGCADENHNNRSSDVNGDIGDVMITLVSRQNSAVSATIPLTPHEIRDNAAKVIQKAYRSYRSRKKISEKMTPNQNNDLSLQESKKPELKKIVLSQAATIIQSAYRSHAAREQLKNSDETLETLEETNQLFVDTPLLTRSSNHDAFVSRTSSPAVDICRKKNTSVHLPLQVMSSTASKPAASNDAASPASNDPSKSDSLLTSKESDTGKDAIDVRALLLAVPPQNDSLSTHSASSMDTQVSKENTGQASLRLSEIETEGSYTGTSETLKDGILPQDNSRCDNDDDDATVTLKNFHECDSPPDYSKKVQAVILIQAYVRGYQARKRIERKLRARQLVAQSASARGNGNGKDLLHRKESLLLVNEVLTADKAIGDDNIMTTTAQPEQTTATKMKGKRIPHDDDMNEADPTCEMPCNLS